MSQNISVTFERFLGPLPSTFKNRPIWSHCSDINEQNGRSFDHRNGSKFTSPINKLRSTHSFIERRSHTRMLALAE